MREIKFRAYDQDEKKMLPGVELSKMLKQITYPYDNSDGGQAIRRHELIWLEYTGLKDKNGREIYEGDILGLLTGIGKRYQELLLTVKWGEYGWDVPRPLGDFEVFGNIYENPELLQSSHEL